MGWEHRSENLYFYRKQRDGSRVKSVYVERGHIADMVAQIQSTSPLLKKVARRINSPEPVQDEKAEASLKNATHLIQLVTEGARCRISPASPTMATKARLAARERRH
jgi:hypothetical protein